MSDASRPHPVEDPVEILETLTEPTAPGRRRIRSLSGLWPFMRPYKAQMAAAVVLLCLGSVTMLLVPIALRELIDHGFSKEATVHSYFLGLFVIALFWGAAVAGRFYFVSWVGERVVADVRSAVYRHMLRQSPAYFETTKTGEVLSRLTADTTLVQTVVGSSVSMGLRSVFQFVGGMVMLGVTSPTLFVVTVGLLLAVVVPLVALGRRLKRLSRESQDRIADSSAVAGEILNAIPTVQAFTKEGDEVGRFDRSVEVSFGSAIRRTRLRAVMTAGMIAGVFGAIVFVLWLGAQAVVAGTMTTGELASFILYALITAGGVGIIAEVWGDVMRAAGATERLMELLHAVPSIQPPANPVRLPETRQARVSFENVRFHYPSRPKTPALDDVSIDIREGETVALVGPSGAGKTTLFQVLLRFYDIGAGAIRFNGIDLRQLDPADLRAHIGIVPQEAVIFSADALENIRYGDAEATDEQVVEAAKTALAHEFISRLPQGY
ncbi:MAG TPA: ABC transporter transmembrane domain-containing protein, partial [Nevskiaceae bacterium]|nr:ABC transporter transmembrane domain-containing protein [Nevskiaceae bacterium]